MPTYYYVRNQNTSGKTNGLDVCLAPAEAPSSFTGTFDNTTELYPSECLTDYGITGEAISAFGISGPILVNLKSNPSNRFSLMSARATFYRLRGGINGTLYEMGTGFYNDYFGNLSTNPGNIERQWSVTVTPTAFIAGDYLIMDLQYYQIFTALEPPGPGTITWSYARATNTGTTWFSLPDTDVPYFTDPCGAEVTPPDEGEGIYGSPITFIG